MNRPSRICFYLPDQDFPGCAFERTLPRFAKAGKVRGAAIARVADGR
jgi:hypothetical protein